MKLNNAMALAAGILAAISVQFNAFPAAASTEALVHRQVAYSSYGPGREMVEAIRTGNVGVVDALLDSMNDD